MIVVAMANQKGGVGKTSTSINLFCGLKKYGYRVLAIDLDPQCNMSATFRAELGGKSALTVLKENGNLKDCIQHTEMGDILPSTNYLSGADAYLTDAGSNYRLQDALETVKEDYDYVVIDTPPALSILSVNAFVAADKIIIPVQAGIYSLQGLDLLVKAIVPVKKHCKHNLEIDGVLLTRFNDRTNLAKALSSGYLAYAEQAELPIRVYNTKIRECVKIGEAQLQGKDIFKFAPDSNAAIDYDHFVCEFLEHNGVNILTLSEA